MALHLHWGPTVEARGSSPSRSTAVEPTPARFRSSVARAGAATLIAVALVGLPWRGRAQERSADRGELVERLTFLEERVAAEYRHGLWWWGGFLGFYTTGAAYQGWLTVGATEKGDQGALGVNTVKALLGVGRLLAQPRGGYSSFEPPPPATLSDAQLAAHVAAGEKAMYGNARQQAIHRAWYAHAGNLGVNLIGGVIVATAFEDPRQGFINAGIGIAVGEVFILTSPWEADNDVEAYEARFEGDGAVDQKESWGIDLRIAPSPTGVMVTGRF